MTEPKNSQLVRWCSGPRADTLWAEFDGDYIVYHRPSGMTHLLNEASRLLICEILTSPADLESIATVFADADAAIDQAIYIEQMQDLLVHLETLGLVARV